jgi:hypothetical protein
MGGEVAEGLLEGPPMVGVRVQVELVVSTLRDPCADQQSTRDVDTLPVARPGQMPPEHTVIGMGGAHRHRPILSNRRVREVGGAGRGNGSRQAPKREAFCRNRRGASA